MSLLNLSQGIKSIWTKKKKKKKQITYKDNRIWYEYL